MSWIVYLAKLTQPNFRNKAETSKINQFITIPYSHFVDFARWSLQIMGINFKEYGYAPAQHVLPIIATRFGNKKGEKFISTSSAVTPVGARESDTKKAKGLTSVPLLVLANGTLLLDSWEIATYAGLDPPTNEFKKTLDTIVGPLARQLAYSFILKKSNENIFQGMCFEGNHWFYKLLWFLGLKSFTVAKLRQFFLPENVAAVKECRDKLIMTVQSIEIDYLKNRNGKYIMGDHITQSDIALAALFAPMLMPPEYCLGNFKKWFDLLLVQDREFYDEVQFWRSTIAGKYVMDLYKSKRASVTLN